MNKTRVLLIGLDAAEWEIINPLMQAGMLPSFKKLISGGVSGKIKTLNPPFSPMLWTSIATGKTADKHGILGFVEPTAENGIRPISTTSRKCRAIWNILSSQNLKSNVIGWWPSHPCEPINGVMISNRFQKIVGKIDDQWPLISESVSGISEEEKNELQSLRIHPEQVGVNELRVFVPELEKVDQEKDFSLVQIRTLIAEALSVKNATLWAMNKNEWDFTAVYFNELDVFSHDFMKFHPPYLNGVPEEYFHLYKNVMVATYTFYDTLIGQLIKSVDSNTNIVLCSDHGFHSGIKRKNKLPEFDAAIALEHNPFGVINVSGPNIIKGQEVYNSSLLDITPTILSMFDLPIGQDMDGRVLEEIYQIPKIDKYIPSWETVSGNFGEHNSKIDPFSEQEALNQLIELGYIAKPENSIEEQITKCLNETQYNLSVVLASKGEYAKAIEIVEKLYEDDMVDLRYNLDLIKYYQFIHNPTKAREILGNFKKFDISNLVNFNYLDGKICVSEHKYQKALEYFKDAVVQSPKYFDLFLALGVLYNKMQDYSNAEVTFKRALSIEPNNHLALHGLTISYNRIGNHEAAIDSGLETIKVSQNFSPAYYHLGEAFYRLDLFEPAIQALELSLKISPNMSRARNLLLNIYKNYKIDNEKFTFHNSIFLKNQKSEFTIVSGLPRSGTSMMMQMLKAGGMDVLVDNVMVPDESNPNGYFEFEPIKNLKLNNECLDLASGKVVKIIAQLLPYTGMKFQQKVIFMERNIDEIVFSQNKMISLKSGKNKGNASFDTRIKNTFQTQLEQIKEIIEEKNNIEILYVNYNNVIENTEFEVKNINAFLNWQLNEVAMKDVVDKNLYRVKIN